MIPGFVRRLIARIRYRHFDDELQCELDVHRAMIEDDARQRGAPADQARNAARRQLGNITLAREDARGVWIAWWVDSFWQDVRYGIRGLLAAPSFTVPAVVVLVVTMGLATSVYATVESLLFRPWPVPDPDRVVEVSVTQRLEKYTVGAASFAEFEAWRNQAHSVDLVAFAAESIPLGDGPASNAEPAVVQLVSTNYFGVLRIPLIAGRALQPGGGPAEMVISHEIWQARFGARPDVVGAVIPVRGVAFTIVGVAAPGTYKIHRGTHAWIPLQARTMPGWTGAADAWRFFQEPRGCCVRIAGRLRNGAGRRQADAEIAALAARFAAAHQLDPAVTAIRGTAGQETGAIDMLALLAAPVSLILLAGCANVGNLQLARGVSRRTNLNIRRALGATRLRIVRQLLVETFILAAAAAVASVWLARSVLPVVLQRFDPEIAGLVTVDAPTMLFAASLSVGVCLMAGALPALRTTQVAQGGQLLGAGPSRLRSSLMSLQVGVSIVLLIGAGLLARGIHHATGDRLGFDPWGVAAISLGLSPDRYGPAERQLLAEALFESAEESGLHPLAGTTVSPFTYVLGSGVRLPDAAQTDTHEVVVHQVTPAYFEILRIPLLAGDVFGDLTPPGDVVVNAAMARHLWPGRSPIGRAFVDDREDANARTLGEGGERRVIGVVGDARSETFYADRPAYYERGAAPEYLLVRDEAGAVESLRGLIERVEPSASPQAVKLTSGLLAQLNEELVMTGAAAALALLALLLATAGTFGVFSYVISERTKEIGVRMALGAGARDVVGMLVSRVSRPLIVGAVAGLLAAQALGVVLGQFLYGISARDPLAYAVVVLILLVAAAIATALPARRALRVDPALTLRVE